MDLDKFCKLNVGEYFHDSKSGDEYLILEKLTNSYLTECTNAGTTRRIVGDRTHWNFQYHACFTLGRHPSNLPQPTVEQPAELFVNVYEQEGEFYTGGTSFKSEQDAYKLGITYKSYRYTAKLVPVVIEQPYTPKHGEKCKVKTTDGNSPYINATAVIIDKKICAVVPFTDSKKFYEPEEIEYFLPLTNEKI